MPITCGREGGNDTPLSVHCDGFDLYIIRSIGCSIEIRDGENYAAETILY